MEQPDDLVEPGDLIQRLLPKNDDKDEGVALHVFCYFMNLFYSVFIDF